MYSNLLQQDLTTTSHTPQYTWLWKIPVPSKIKIFLWLIIHNSLPTRQYLHHIGILIDDHCQICNSAQETINDIFLHCPNIQQMWTHLGLMDVINHISRFSHTSEWLMNIIKTKKNHMPYRINNKTIISYTLWHIWLARNNHNFNRTQHQLSTKLVTNQALEFTYLATSMHTKPNLIMQAIK